MLLKTYEEANPVFFLCYGAVQHIHVLNRLVLISSYHSG